MKSSRAENTKKNIISGLINKIIILLLQFISRKIFIVYIGIEYLGLNSLFTNVLSLLSMADLGFGIAMAYSYYEPLARKDYDRLAGLMHFYKRIYNIIAIVILVLGIVLLPFLKYIVNTEQTIEYLYIYYILQLANTVISYLFVYKSTIITADQKQYIVNKITIRVNVIKTLLQIVTIIIFRNYIFYCICDIGATFFNNIYISRIANKMYPFLQKRVAIESNVRKTIISNMSSVFLYKFSASIMGGTDSIIMSSIIGTATVGLYSNYLTVTQQLTNFTNIIFSSFTASLGNLLIEEDKDKNYKVFKMMQTVSFVVSGIVSVCILNLINDLIYVWLGPQYQMGQDMIMAIALNTYFTISLQPIWTYREASGLYRKTRYVMVFTAILNIILSIILGMVIGAAGIIYATVFARISTYFWYEPKLIYRMYFGKSSVRYYLNHCANLALIIILYILLLEICSHISVINVFDLLRKSLITFGCTLVVYCTIYFHSKEWRTVIKKLFFYK